MAVALLVLFLILLLLGGGAFASSIQVLWYILIAALIAWAVGFFVRAAEGGDWYRW